MFQEFMRDQELRVKDKMAFGNTDGFPIYVEVKALRKGLMDVYINIGNASWQEVRKDFMDMGKEIRCKVFYERQTIKLTYVLSPQTMRAEFPVFLKRIASILRKNGVEPPKNCVICEKENCDSLAFIGTENNPIHKQCLQDYLMKVRNKVEDNRRWGNYFTGLVGAVLGMVVGAIPLIFSMWIVNQLFSVLFVLIPISTYFGYKFFRGKMNAFVIILAILFSVVGVYFSEIALWCLELLDKSQLTWEFVLQKCLVWLQSTETWVTLTTEGALHFFFAALGIVLAWGQITMTNSKKIERVEEVLDTVTQNPFYQEE